MHILSWIIPAHVCCTSGERLDCNTLMTSREKNSSGSRNCFEGYSHQTHFRDIFLQDWGGGHGYCPLPDPVLKNYVTYFISFYEMEN